jgi:glycosyltransferase involved in cell wall biosynthesis
LRVLTLALDAGSGYGGAEKLAYEFARRLDREQFKSYLCTIRAPFPDREKHTARDRHELTASGVEFVGLNERFRFLVRPGAWRRLYALLARESIDVLHAHMPRASVPGAILARLAHVPVVISHEHGSTLEGKRIRPFLDRNVVARMSTMLLAVSEWDRRQLIEHERIPPDRIRVMPNGIAAPREPARNVRQELLGGVEDVALIGSIGRLYDQKGYDYLVQAVAELKRSGRSLRCVIAGTGPQEAWLRGLIADFGVSAEVTLLGRRDDVADVVRALDVAVLPSRWEGSPLVLMEYMAVAAPIVATAVGGVPDLIENEVHGLLVPPHEPHPIAHAVGRLLDDRELAHRLGQAARRRQRAEYDLDVVVRRLERLYRELFDRAERR